MGRRDAAEETWNEKHQLAVIILTGDVAYTHGFRNYLIISMEA